VSILALLLCLGLTAAPALAEPPDCADCPDMVAIPAGTLAREGAPPVAIAPFHMARTETTFDQWAACVAAQACRGGQHDHGWGRGSRPVINVTHTDAEAYAAWLSGVTGERYRLPTEDEWEWAARGGTTTKWWWGDTVGQGHANCRKCGTEWSGRMSAPVASLPANPFGLHDMAGNVWEWVADCWHQDRAAAPTARDCTRRVTKGGAWYYIPSQSKPTTRVGSPTGLWSYTVGFRVVRE